METQSRECAGNEGPQGVIVTSPELCRGMEPPTPQTLVAPKCPPCRTAPRCPLSPPHHNRSLPGRDPAQPVTMTELASSYSAERRARVGQRVT